MCSSGWRARVSAAAAARWAGGGQGAGCRAARAWRGRPRSRKWPRTRGTEQGLLRLGPPLQSISRRSPTKRQAAAAARPPAVRSPRPCCLAFPHSISCHCNANPATRYRLASPNGESRQRRRKRRSGAKGPGLGRKGREGGRGERDRLGAECASGALSGTSRSRRRRRHGSPKQPLAPHQRKGGSGRPHQFREPKAESRHRHLQERDNAKQRPDPHTRLRVPTGTARVLFSSAPPPPGGGVGAMGSCGSLEEGAAEGLPRLG